MNVFFLVSCLFEVLVGTDEASKDLFQKQHIIVKHHQIQKKEREKTNTRFATCLIFSARKLYFFRGFYNQNSATWGNESFVEISTFNRSPGDFFVTETRWEDEGNLTRCHFRLDIDSGCRRAIIDSIDISWCGGIPFDIIAKGFVFGRLDHEYLWMLDISWDIHKHI